ncbi:hypothetical protein BD769DRAFT_1383711 [Suillus cothurnatus]|nr:hypothetical protein BD769DRAFT_1383711 [Suillus cothurnatus]
MTSVGTAGGGGAQYGHVSKRQFIALHNAVAQNLITGDRLRTISNAGEGYAITFSVRLKKFFVGGSDSGYDEIGKLSSQTYRIHNYNHSADAIGREGRSGQASAPNRMKKLGCLLLNQPAFPSTVTIPSAWFVT